MDLELVIVEGPHAGRRLPVTTNPTVFGRSPSAALSFPQDGYMSSNHLMVQAALQGVQLTDLHSSNGTFLNGQRITQAVANAGDTVRLGNLTLRVQPAQSEGLKTPAPHPSLPRQEEAPILPAAPFVIPRRHDSGTSVLPMLGRELLSQPPAPAQPATPPLPTPVFSQFSEDLIRERVLQHLTGAEATLYCLLDAAGAPGLEQDLLKLQVDSLPYSLYGGDPAATRIPCEPCLFPLTPSSPLLRLFVERGWGKAWASYFTSSAPLEELRKHFRRFLMVQLEGKGEVYFRFYDPRVLRDFFPTATLQELLMFSGPVLDWYLEGETSQTMLRFRSSPQGLLRQVVPLA